MKRFFIIIVLFIALITTIFAKESFTVALCRPIVQGNYNQIKNIIVLKKNFFKGSDFKLICVYNSEEKTDYTNAKKYVKKNKLDWVIFKVIKGKEKIENIYKKNSWSKDFKEIFMISDAVIFTGGMDLPPELYNSKHHLSTNSSTPFRSYYETSFLFHLIGGSRNKNFTPLIETKKNYKILGICLGLQTMNVASGGTLYQDIPSEIYKLKYIEDIINLKKDNIHSNRYVKESYYKNINPAPALHRIKIEKDIIWEKMKISKQTIPYVYSAHHQCIKDLAKDYRAVAYSMDKKIIEAIAHKKYINVIGVQFHPEVWSIYSKGSQKYDWQFKKNNFYLQDFFKEKKDSLIFHKNFWLWFFNE